MDGAVISAIIALWGGLLLFFAREWFKRQATNKAVLAEVQRLITVFKRHEKWWRERLEAEDTDHPLIPFSMPVYVSQLETIGLLNTTIVAHVVEFFGYLSFLNDFQATRADYIKRRRSRDFDKMYLETLERLSSSLPPQFDELFRRYGVA